MRAPPINVKISAMSVQMSAVKRLSSAARHDETEKGTEARMSTEYYLIRKNAVPEVLQKVVEVNKLLESGQVRTVGEAASRIGISRSSYYKFKDDIQEFHDSIAGKTLTLTMDINDEQGVLCDILKIIADGGANILTIHQSIPMSGIANVSISVQIIGGTDNVSNMMLDSLERLPGVRKLRITGRQGF